MKERPSLQLGSYAPTWTDPPRSRPEPTVAERHRMFYTLPNVTFKSSPERGYYLPPPPPVFGAPSWISHKGSETSRTCSSSRWNNSQAGKRHATSSYRAPSRPTSPRYAPSLGYSRGLTWNTTLTRRKVTSQGASASRSGGASSRRHAQAKSPTPCPNQ